MNVVVDIADLVVKVFDRLQVDSAGESVRDLLESYSTVPAEQRIVHASTLSDLVPAAPFLAFRRGPAPVVEDTKLAAHFYWFIYEAPDQTYISINALLKPIMQAYNSRSNPLIFNGAPLGQVDILVGEERPDPSLGGMLMTQLTLTVYC